MRRMLNKLCFALLLTLGAGNMAMAQAQTTDTLHLSLKEAQDYAMQNGAKAKNSALDTKITKWRTVEILTQGLPTVSASASYQYAFKLQQSVLPKEFSQLIAAFDTTGSVNPNEPTLISFGTKNNASLGLNVTVPIMDGRYIIGLQANKAFLAVAQQQSVVTENDVRNSVSNSYYAALIANESLRIIDDNLKNLRQLQYETAELYKAGFAEELDTDRISLNLSNLQSQYNSALIRAQLTEAVLKGQLGVDIEAPIALTDSLQGLMGSVAAAAADTNFDYTTRPEYKLLELSTKIKGFDATQTRAGYFPSLAGLFNYGANNYFIDGSSWQPFGTVGIQLNIPIFDSYRTGAAYQQKKLTQLKAKNDLDDFKLQATVQFKAARSNYMNALNDYESQKRNLALAQKIFDKVKDKNKEGLATSFELSQSETDLTQTQGNYINAIYNLLVTKTELEKALGKY